VKSPNTPDDFIGPWVKCPTCTTGYQHQLRNDLSDEFKLFVDEQYPECGWRHLVVQTVMLGTVVNGALKSKKERHNEIIETSLSVIDQLSMQHVDPTIHRSIELLKACALKAIAQIILNGEDLTEDEAKKGYCT
jgi:hypothetical protein